MTPGVEELSLRIPNGRVQLAVMLRAHTNGDWGELSAYDKRVNEQALKSGTLEERVIGSYRLGTDEIWIISEPYPGDELGIDRELGVLTTLLLPEEY